ncbi:MAG: tetratricopeptide repeat protein, partial [Alphaproteobacteria bacterium]|nr:tetratricopeptide repeat protein [Alphaproteobacteria bacterium]
MADTLLDDLKRQLADPQGVVVIVGAGVSIGATGGEKLASWTGLLRHGVTRCGEVAQPLPKGWADRVLGEIESGDMTDLLSAAEKISTKLKERGGEWGRWLRDCFKPMKAKDRKVLEALRDLGVTIATTNYDGLIEEVTGLDPVTWRDGSRVERVLRGDEKAVLHLHGHWQSPDSVILGIRDYEAVLGHDHAQLMQHAMRATKTLVYVGCGDGLGDPNFGALLKWSATVFARSEYRHFRLARNDEVDALQRSHASGERVFVLPYGEKHDHLTGFLRGLRRNIAAPPPTPTAAVVASTLPPRPLCIARDALIAELATALVQPTPRPIPILGPPGIGKSTIGLSALHDPRVAATFGPRRYFIRCDELTSASAVTAALAATLGLPLGPQMANAVESFLSESPAALVLDNAETPWEGDILGFEELLQRFAAVPGLSFAVSLRGATRPLGVHWHTAVEPKTLSPADARSVFRAVAGSAFDTDPHLDELLRALDGVPHAIVLMACAAQGQSTLADLLERWRTERTRLLHRAGGTSRLLNIETSYAISIASPRLTPEGKRLLALLATQPGGIAHRDVSEILPKVGASAGACLRQLGLAADEGCRLRVLSPLREFVNKSLPCDPALQVQMRTHYLEIAKRDGEKVGGVGGDFAISRISSEIQCIEEAIIGSISSPLVTDAIAAAAAILRYNRFTGTNSDRIICAIIDVSHFQNDVLYAKFLARLGDIAIVRYNLDEAKEHLNNALKLYRRFGDAIGIALCTHRLGEIPYRLSDFSSASKQYEAALRIYKRCDFKYGEANCTQRLGDIARHRSDYSRAIVFYDKALNLFKQSNGIRGEANCILNIGHIELARGEYKKAVNNYNIAIPLYESVGYLGGIAHCWRGLGKISQELRAAVAARDYYVRSSTLYRRVGELKGEADCIHSLGQVAVAARKVKSAIKHFNEAIAVYRKIPDFDSIGCC